MSGTVIKHKRKSGVFNPGELSPGEMGVDITSGDLYVSSTGTDLTRYVSTSTVSHGTNENAARPSGVSKVVWIGSVAPANAVSGDEWYDTSS